MKDGGPAFPVCIRIQGADDNSARGMSLRDWFAGMAMQGYIAAGVPSDATYRDMAEKFYSAADAMLEVRERDDDMPWCERCGSYHSSKAEHIK